MSDAASLLEKYATAADWYRRCLEDVIDRRAVRGLDEARAGYDSAFGKVTEHLHEEETMDDPPTTLEELEATRAALRRLIAAVEAEDQDVLDAHASFEVSAALGVARECLRGDVSV